MAKNTSEITKNNLTLCTKQAKITNSYPINKQSKIFYVSKLNNNIISAQRQCGLMINYKFYNESDDDIITILLKSA